MKHRIISSILLIVLLPNLIILLLIHAAVGKTMDNLLEKDLLEGAIIVNNVIDVIPQVASVPFKEATEEDVFAEFLKLGEESSDEKALRLEEEARWYVENSAIEGFFVVDRNGRVLLSKNIYEEGLTLMNTGLYQDIMNGAEQSFDIIIGNDGIKKFRLSLPIKDSSGDVIGIVNGNIDAKRVLNAMRNMRAGNDEQIFLVGKDVILFNPEIKKADYGTPGDFRGKCQLNNLIADFREGKLAEDKGIIRYTTKGKQMIASYARMQNTEAMVVVAQDRNAAFSQVKNVYEVTFGACVSILVGALLIAVLMGVRLYSPIKEIQLQITRVMEGTRVEPPNLSHYGELADIHKNINQMGEHLRRSEIELSQVLRIDGLTRLDTSGSLQEVMDSLLYTQENQALLMMVFDDLENINHTHGYEMGNEVLKEIGHVLKSIPEDICHAFRLGGSGFLVFMSGWEGNNNPEAVAKFIIKESSKIRFVKDVRVNIDVSIGIRYIHKGEPEGVQTLIQQSNLVMRRARATGKNAYVIFNKDGLDEI